MTRPILTTDRLRLVPMTIVHLPLLIELDSDPEVLRQNLGRARDEREVHDPWGPVCSDTEADAVGLGWWVGYRRDNGEFLGWWDLSPAVPVVEHPRQAEVGWRLMRRSWRQGYATEGAFALLDHGFGSVRLTAVRAETMAVNQASRGVMSKLGMRHVSTEHRSWDDPLPGSEHGEVVYEITREEWLGEKTARKPTKERVVTAERETLADRVRGALPRDRAVRELPMFGGLSFLVDDAMVVAVRRDDLLVRIERARRDELLEVRGATPAVMGKDRDMGVGWITVSHDGLATDEQLAFWVRVGLEHRAAGTAGDHGSKPARGSRS